jgi:hypothetical protein
MRQVEWKQARRALVVTHGLTIRCFVMRFLLLTRRAEPWMGMVLGLEAGREKKTGQQACQLAQHGPTGRGRVLHFTLRGW